MLRMLNESAWLLGRGHRAAIFASTSAALLVTTRTAVPVRIATTNTGARALHLQAMSLAVLD